ncbi:CoA-binding protein [Candidatus Woesearchaeota archaeon]|nr:CoA-binding protein [Candidatus Woesearchaeota archaeon]
MTEFISKKFTYAVVGASNNQDKYGYKVLKELSGKGYSVVPVNPKEKEILGLRAYRSISEVKKADVVIFVVKPEVTLEVLKECLKTRIDKVWFQPGSESSEAIEFCTKNRIDFFLGCMLIQKK